MEKIEHIIFDFDFTIAATHLHSESAKVLFSLPQMPHNLKVDEFQNWDPLIIDYIWQSLKSGNKLIPTGNARDWQKIFKRLIDNHYKVYIASFSSFEPIIKRFLKEIIQLPDPYLDKIVIEAWLPSNQQNKNVHLDRIVSGTPLPTPINWQTQSLSNEQRKLLYKKLILVDDTLKNIESVLDLAGYKHAIVVPHKSSLVTPIIMDTLSERLGISF